MHFIKLALILLIFKIKKNNAALHEDLGVVLKMDDQIQLNIYHFIRSYEITTIKEMPRKSKIRKR